MAKEIQLFHTKQTQFIIDDKPVLPEAAEEEGQVGGVMILVGTCHQHIIQADENPGQDTGRYSPSS